MNRGEEVTRGLVIACRNRTKLLEFGDEVLDQMSRRVHVAIERAGLLAIGLPDYAPSSARSCMVQNMNNLG